MRVVVVVEEALQSGLSASRKVGEVDGVRDDGLEAGLDDGLDEGRSD